MNIWNRLNNLLLATFFIKQFEVKLMNIKTRVILKCNENERKPVRIMVYENASEFFIRLDLFGMGLNFEYKEFTAGGFKREHLAHERLEEEITCLEQINFEVAKRNDNSVQTLAREELKSKPIMPLSYAKLSDKKSAAF